MRKGTAGTGVGGSCRFSMGGKGFGALWGERLIKKATEEVRLCCVCNASLCCPCGEGFRGAVQITVKALGG